MIAIEYEYPLLLMRPGIYLTYYYNYRTKLLTTYPIVTLESGIKYFTWKLWIYECNNKILYLFINSQNMIKQSKIKRAVFVNPWHQRSWTHSGEKPSPKRNSVKVLYKKKYKKVGSSKKITHQNIIETWFLPNSLIYVQW